MFRSFYLAGFECATGYNMHGQWIDQIAATEHDLHVEADYHRLAEVGIHAVREAIRWPLVDRGGSYDFASVEPFVQAALRHDFDVIWDLFHYGYPDDLDPFGDAFVHRFARYCGAAASYIARRMHHCYFTPINEPSYFAWAAAEVGRFAPHVRGRGFELKMALGRAALAGITAIRAACPAARIVNVDPICRVVPGSDDPAAREHARRFNEQWVFEFWDLVSGRAMPELGGTPERLDVVGVNYYWTNQWELGVEGVPLAERDPRRVSLADLVRATWRRYGREIIITETSALGEARAPWIHELSAIAEELIGEGIPLAGICLYPILGMPEWHARDQWTRMGLWDLERDQEALQRRACRPMVEALQKVQSDNVARNFVLPRTGSAPLEFHGRIVWERRRSRAYSIRLFRRDAPHRSWVLAVTVPAAITTIEHASTATVLQDVLDALKELTCERIARTHSMHYDPPIAAVERQWREDIDDLVRRAAEIEAMH